MSLVPCDSDQAGTYIHDPKTLQLVLKIDDSNPPDAYPAIVPDAEAGPGEEDLPLSGNGTVSRNGTMSGNGTVSGNGNVSANGTVSGNGTVTENGTVYESGIVPGNGTASGNGTVSRNGPVLPNGTMSGNGTASGPARASETGPELAAVPEAIPALCLAVLGGSVDDGALLTLAPCVNETGEGSSQSWDFLEGGDDGGEGRNLVSQFTGQCVTAGWPFFTGAAFKMSDESRDRYDKDYAVVVLNEAEEPVEFDLSFPSEEFTVKVTIDARSIQTILA